MEGPDRPRVWKTPPGVAVAVLDDIKDPGARSVVVQIGEAFFHGFLVRKDGEVRGYIDRCPHAGYPLAVELDRYLTDDGDLILCSKGIERGSLKLMTDVLVETIPPARTAVLSGPSFAADVVRGLPTAVTLACPDPMLGALLVQAIAGPTFRPYLADDLIGAEVGGAIKNVLAIACGISEGRGLGRSAHAGLITRGFAEMTRIGVALGGKAETVAGLCGLGDLVLTCSSPQSRNMSVGLALGLTSGLDARARPRWPLDEATALSDPLYATGRKGAKA